MALIGALRAIVGNNHVATGIDGHAALGDIRGVYRGRALALVTPGSVAEVAAVVRECVKTRTPIVVQGGNTGLMGAATPDDSGRAIVLQLGRLNAVRNVDTDNDTITVEAGCVLQQVQDAARACGRLFPLSLGAEGSCTLGGNLGTNAGGTQVLRYGNTRDLTLGLEVVTAEGDIWHGLRGLRKDNTGYDLRDLYIGSEGTLGIITAATLKLYPLPVGYHTGLLTFVDLEQAVAFLSVARQGWGAALTAFEVMSGRALQLVAADAGLRPPFLPHVEDDAWYALLELSEGGEGGGGERFEQVLGLALEQGRLVDALIAQNESQRLAMWQLREHGISEAQAREGRNIKHDISLPISRLAPFVADCASALERHYPGVRVIAFGHLGDGNLHYNVSAPAGCGHAGFLAQEEGIHRVVYDCVQSHDGSISAEHGIGQVKRDVLPYYKTCLELQLMQRIKAALDPLNLLNPGKVLATGTERRPLQPLLDFEVNS
ncbi:FAD-binding oxidoreductase [Paludibacterium yongneupense]|uniref:FAD-binding oxidoreductase n=1 Tax=Paludibacterium yongneupense TaxID=400061 RepID=UPI00041BCA43|nr:FAD-binding oxidoreductase [Paludibacterium yongneupense]